MSRLLNRSLKRIILYAALIIGGSIPVYYLSIALLWKHELREHNVVLSAEAIREDRYLIIGMVTLLAVIFFALLVSGLTLLSRSIRAVYNQQKEFADNASHELQTPLAIIQSKLELLMQSKSLTSEQYTIIEDAMKASARVTRINKNLLLLAKIENSQFMQKEPIHLSALLPQTLTTFSNFSDDKNLLFETAIEQDVFVEGNQLLVEILINNLITNAIRYSAANETIRLQLRNNSLLISNAGIARLNQDQLFKRFGATSPETPGTGLGLALVKQVCDRYHWKVSYTFEKQQHIFSILF